MTGSTYEIALTAIESVNQRDVECAGDACRSILLSHGRRTRRATLFLHGMSASPQQFRELAVYAHAQGDNVFVPRLPKHGHRDRLSPALQDLRSSDLIACAEQSIEIASGLGDEIRVVGFSLGGLIATWIAQHHSTQRVIAIAPFLGLPGLPPALNAVVAAGLRRVPNVFFWWNPMQREKMLPLHGYPRFGTRAVAESLALSGKLFDMARLTAPRSPIVFVTNRGEVTVSNGAIRQLIRAWNSINPSYVEHCRLTGLGLSHDIIEPLRERSKTDKSYPMLIKLLQA